MKSDIEKLVDSVELSASRRAFCMVGVRSEPLLEICKMARIGIVNEKRRPYESHEDATKRLAGNAHPVIAEGFQVRFDGPPGPEAGRFVEVEMLDGVGIRLGEWVKDGEYWLLRFKGE